MKNIAIVVESDFMYTHVGVRSLISSLYNSLNLDKDFTVDFISYHMEEGRGGVWFKIFASDDMLTNNFSEETVAVSGSARDLLSAYKSEAFKREGKIGDNRLLYQQVGGDLDIVDYCCLIISAPWIVQDFFYKFDIPLIGVVYDMIPCDYVLLNPTNKPYDFAYSHKYGYDFYSKKCALILSISKATRYEYLRYYPECEEKVKVIPPMAPVYIKNSISNSSLMRKNNVILAGVWDPRKGLYKIPRLLEGLENDIDQLYIYGKPRCSAQDVKNFLKSILRFQKITWYYKARADDLQKAYSQSKILLFPSHHEGLGLPLMEAQAHGCRILVSKFESASELLLKDGGYYLNNNDKDKLKLRDMLREDYNDLKLSDEAVTTFNANAFPRFLKEFI